MQQTGTCIAFSRVCKFLLQANNNAADHNGPKYRLIRVFPVSMLLRIHSRQSCLHSLTQFISGLCRLKYVANQGLDQAAHLKLYRLREVSLNPSLPIGEISMTPFISNRCMGVVIALV